MLKKFILPVIVSLAFISCNSQKKATDNTSVTMPKTADKVVNSTYPAEKPLQDIVRLVEKQNTFLKDKQINITFKRTVDDSRCPMNARCIWAGNATVEVELMTPTSRPVLYKLSIGDLRGNLVDSIEFSGYKITLENLYPSNSTETNFTKLKGKYVIDLKVEKSQK